MTGGLLSIISYGVDDLYLTGAPQITFFKIVYRRHTNFSIQSIEVGLNTTVNFNDQYEMIIDRYGDLIGKVYLKINFPETYFSYKQFGITSQVNQTAYNPYTEFQIVQKFMQPNTNAYTQVYNDAQVQNYTLQELLDDVQSAFQGATESINEYNNLLQSKINSGNYTAACLLYSANIYNLYLMYNGSTTETPQQFYTSVQNAFTYSQQCYKYFWDQYNVYNQQLNMSKQQNLKFAWNKYLGHNIIEYVDATLGEN